MDVKHFCRLCNQERPRLSRPDCPNEEEMKRQNRDHYYDGVIGECSCCWISIREIGWIPSCEGEDPPQ